MPNLLKRLRLLEAWRKPAGPTPKEKMPNTYKTVKEAADALETLMEHAEALSASLAFWAAKQTCDEALQDTTPAPWRDCSPEQRLKLIAARKETHDNEVLRARQSLAAFRAAFPGEG